MPRITPEFRRGTGYRGAFEAYYTGAIQQAEQAALRATDKAGRLAKATIRQQMQAAGLGRLGNAIDATSDLQRGRGVFRFGAQGFSASGTVFVRTRSERTLGAIASYTEGADIRPRRGRWLWIATDEIPRVTNRYRMTPDLYRKNGYEQKIGPLVLIRGINGYPLLVVRGASVSEVGRARSARSLTKSGRLRKGQRSKDFIVAFFAIPNTTRAARVNARAILEQQAAALPDLWAREMGRT